MNNEMRPRGSEGADLAAADAGKAGSDPAGEGSKGIFDHLAEYLLQQPLPRNEASAARAQDAELPADRIGEQSAPQRPVSPGAGQEEMRAEELVFVETAEQLLIEKEVVVREEVVLSKLVENHVQEIEDRVRRTEVEVERISPEEAGRIVGQGAPQVHAAPSPPVLPQSSAPRPVPPTIRQGAAPAAKSKGWWAWFALILCAAMLLAFALGQFLGSAS